MSRQQTASFANIGAANSPWPGP